MDSSCIDDPLPSHVEVFAAKILSADSKITASEKVVEASVVFVKEIKAPGVKENGGLLDCALRTGSCACNASTLESIQGCFPV